MCMRLSVWVFLEEMANSPYAILRVFIRDATQAEQRSRKSLDTRIAAGCCNFVRSRCLVNLKKRQALTPVGYSNQKLPRSQTAPQPLMRAFKSENLDHVGHIYTIHMAHTVIRSEYCRICNTCSYHDDILLQLQLYMFSLYSSTCLLRNVDTRRSTDNSHVQKHRVCANSILFLFKFRAELRLMIS